MNNRVHGTGCPICAGQTILELFNDGAQALAVETAIKRWWRKDLRLPAWLTPELMSCTGGWSETISDEALGDVEILTRIKTESAAHRVSA